MTIDSLNYRRVVKAVASPPRVLDFPAACGALFRFIYMAEGFRPVVELVSAVLQRCEFSCKFFFLFLCPVFEASLYFPCSPLSFIPPPSRCSHLCPLLGNAATLLSPPYPVPPVPTRLVLSSNIVDTKISTQRIPLVSAEWIPTV
jgi:hypothetical protein